VSLSKGGGLGQGRPTVLVQEQLCKKALREENSLLDQHQSILLAALVLVTFSLQAGALGQPRLKAQFGAGPALNGKLDETCWENAPAASGFLLEKTGAKPSQDTVVRFAADESALYIGVYAAESQWELVRARAQLDKGPGRAGNVRQDDYVEVRLDVTNRREKPGPARPFRVAVNANGAIAVDSQGIGDVRKLCSATAQKMQEAWAAEIRVSWEALGIIPPLRCRAALGLNVFRCRAYGSAQEERSVWPEAFARGDQPKAMAEIEVGPSSDLTVEGLAVEQPLWGEGNRAKFYIKSASGPKPARPGDVKLAAAVANKRPQWFAASVGKRVSPAALSYDISSFETSQMAEFRVRGDSGRTLYRVRRPLLIPPLIEVRLRQPAYRGYIFPDSDKPALPEIEAQIECNATPARLSRARISVRLEDEAGKALQEEQKPARRAQVIALAASGLARSGRLLASFHEGASTLGSDYATLRKLTASEAASLPSYVDSRDNLIIGGQPFFPLGWYGGHHLQHLDEVADSPFNCLLDYGINHLAPEEIRSYLDAAQKRGVKIIYCMNDLYPTTPHLRRVGPWEGYEQMLTGVVSTFRDHPSIIAWYLNDELPTQLAPAMRKHYERMCELDPGHPGFIVHFMTSALAPFVPTTDILGLDSYPIPNHPAIDVSQMTDAGWQATKELKPVWMVLQAFAWYQYWEPDDPNATGGRGRAPTELELRKGRAPTRDEVRCMTYLALTHGAKGLLYYCYYDLRVLPQYKEMWGWLKEIGREVKALSPVLLSGKRLTSRSSAGIHTLLLEHEGALYLLAVNGEQKAARCKFQMPARARGPIEVMFEGRQIGPSGALIADEFGPLQAHVYRIQTGS